MTKRERLAQLAKSVGNGDKVEVHYERPLKVLKSKTDRQFTKLSIMEFAYDERTYFQQLREVNGLNKQAERPELYKHEGGCLYSKLDAPEKLYIRICAPESRLKKTVMIFEGDKEIKINDILDIIQASERPKYSCNDFQTSTGNMGHEIEDRIQPVNYDLDKVFDFKVVKK